MGNVLDKTVQGAHDFVVKPVDQFVIQPTMGVAANFVEKKAVVQGEPLEFSRLWVRQWVDVFDKKHQKWYEGQIVLIYQKNEDDRNDKSFARVHFKGWSAQWDENIIESDISERIHSLHSHTPFAPSVAKIYEEPLYDEQNELSHIPVEAGTKVDVQDPTGTWTHGTVVKFDIIDFEGDEEHKLRTLMVKVSYTCWGPRWDEWINMDSYRLAPYKMQCDLKLEKRMVLADKEFRKRILKRGTIHDVKPGKFERDSLFAAISDQLYGDQKHHAWIRYIVHFYMSTYPDRFEPLVHGDFQYYLHRLAHNEEMPEGQPEMFAISEIYCRPVHLFSVNERDEPVVYMSGLPPPDNMEEDETPQNPHTPLVLSYHLDGMYNSIRSIQPQYMTSNPGVYEQEIERQILDELRKLGLALPADVQEEQLSRVSSRLSSRLTSRLSSRSGTKMLMMPRKHIYEEIMEHDAEKTERELELERFEKENSLGVFSKPGMKK